MLVHRCVLPKGRSLATSSRLNRCTPEENFAAPQRLDMARLARSAARAVVCYQAVPLSCSRLRRGVGSEIAHAMLPGAARSCVVIGQRGAGITLRRLAVARCSVRLFGINTRYSAEIQGHGKVRPIHSRRNSSMRLEVHVATPQPKKSVSSVQIGQSSAKAVARIGQSSGSLCPTRSRATASKSA